MWSNSSVTDADFSQSRRGAAGGRVCYWLFAGKRGGRGRGGGGCEARLCLSGWLGSD